MNVNTDLCKEALTAWGETSQTDMAIEEMSELIKAILKYRRDRTSYRYEDICEEYADVMFTLKQLEIIMIGIDENFNTYTNDYLLIKHDNVRKLLDDYYKSKNK